MKTTIKLLSLIISGSIFFSACSNKGGTAATVYYKQQDQVGRPAINTVFNVGDSDKEKFNVTVPSAMQAAFQSKFQARLLALNPGYTTNALTLDAPTFTTVLSNDVLNVSMSGTTTFFDGTNVLTGRNLSDDVIHTELLLIFGGPAGTSNPGLSDDHVPANDVAFLTAFPYEATPH